MLKTKPNGKGVNIVWSRSAVQNYTSAHGRQNMYTIRNPHASGSWQRKGEKEFWSFTFLRSGLQNLEQEMGTF